MITVIVDGYNFIFNSYFKALYGQDELQWLRDDAVNFLSKYYNVKKNKVIVVFDGYNTDEPFESKMNRQNIEVIYSKKNEKADEVIVRLARASDNAVVVTNDNDIIRRASGFNCSCMSVEEFKSLAESLIAGHPGTGHRPGGHSADKENGGGGGLPFDTSFETAEDGIVERNINGVKKGNPRKLSKKERMKARKIKKL